MTKPVFFIKKNWLLLSLVFFASLLIILFNFYSIKVSASIRAYINAESSYSKGQKDAVRYLLHYMESGSAEDWSNYQKNINIPFGPRKFRLAVLTDTSTELLNQYMLEGRNHEEDLDNFIWLYRNFHKFGFMQESIELWTQGDALNLRLNAIANLVHNEILTGTTEELDLELVSNEITTLNEELSLLEYRFSENLSGIGRMVESYLYDFNLLIVILVVGGGGFYFVILINRLNKSEAALKIRNQHLNVANMELDKFVYSVSHDLRAPLTSIQGLVNLLRMDPDAEEVETCLNMIDESLVRQDRFIKKILSYSKNKRINVEPELIHFEDFINSVFQDLEHSESAKAIRFEKDIQLEELLVDEDRLRIVLNNIVSNAIEYSDASKPFSFIKVSSQQKNNTAIISIEDNGLGIQKEYQERIFEMFFSASSAQKGSGIGLYIVKEAVEKMGGTISLTSEFKKGTTFTISLPLLEVEKPVA